MGDIQAGDTVTVQFQVNQVLRSGRLELKSADSCIYVQEPEAVKLVSRPRPPEPTVEGIYVLAGSVVYVREFSKSSVNPWREVNTNSRYNWGYVTGGSRRIKVLAEVEGNKVSDKIDPVTSEYYEGQIALLRERSQQFAAGLDKIANVLDEMRKV